MQRRAPSATSALLQKVNSQLKGEIIKKPEDELDAYISTLTQKTSQQKKSVNFEDLGESISISSDIEDAPYAGKTQPSAGSSSKFLKKKSVDENAVGPGAGASKFLKKSPQVENEDLGASGSKFLKKPQKSAVSPSPAAVTQNRYGGTSEQSIGARSVQSSQGMGTRQASSALQKATALTGKIQQKAETRKAAMLESDSDESFNVQMAKSVGDLHSDSLTSESVKIGRDGGKFLKKAAPAKGPTQSTEPPGTSVTQKTEKRAGIPEKVDSQTKKASPYTLKSSLKYSTEVVLNSEEESLAEFVEGLPSSSGDSFDKYKRQPGRQGKRHTPSPPPSRQGKRSPSPPPPARQPSYQTPGGNRRSPSPTTKPPAVRRTPSPSPRASAQSPGPYLRKRSPSPKLLRSLSDDSNVADSIRSEVADDYDLGVNIIMDLDDLAPADESSPQRAESPFKSASKENQKPKKSSLKSSSSSDIHVKDYPKLDKSPFKASENTDNSPFKASQAQRDTSPFKSKGYVDDSPFKSKTSDSPFKAKSRNDSSPFSAKTDYRSKTDISPFKDKVEDSPFKTKAESPFKAKADSPFKAKTESSVFKSSARSSSPFKAADKDRSESSSFKAKKDKSGRKSPFKSGEKETKRSKKKKSDSPRKKKSKKDKDDIFGSFGLQTVEDLLGDSVKVSEFESVISDVEGEKSELSEEIKTEKPSVYSYNKFDDSASEVASEVGSVKQSGPSYTEDFESISEQIGASTVRERKYISVSEVKTKYSVDETVADYTEFSKSETESVASESALSGYSDRSYSRSYTSYTDDYSRSLVRTSTDLTPLPRSGMKTAEAQTVFESGGLHYQWDPFASGLSFPGVPLGLGFVDPSPIATHVVSADALEAMTAYSPAMLALQDMLKAQLELTREFLQNQERLYKEYTSDIQPNYHYTTLEDTKQYIKKHRKKKLTFKEALKLVDQEMGRSHR